MKWLSTLCCLVLVAACGGETSRGTGEPSAGQAGTAPGTGFGGGGFGGTGLSGAGGSGALPNTSDWLMPLQVGLSWTFEITPLDPSTPPVCGRSGPVAAVTGKRSVPTAEGETEAFVYHSICSNQSVVVWGTRDDLEYIPIDPDTDALTDAARHYMVPPAEGVSWGMYAWRGEPDVSVPAGSFGDCWRRDLTDPSAMNSYQIYCRGIGPVVMQDNVNFYRAELSSRGFAGN